jgi:heme/copper-type cytochrome/quinol oxidase subunit 4
MFMRNWIHHMSRYSTLAGVALLPIAAQEPVNEGSIALIVFLVAVGLTLLLAVGLAVLMWVLSLRSPHAVVGAEPKVVKQREELPAGVHMPSPSIQPLILAIGVTIVGFGIVFRGLAISLGEDFSIPIIMVLGLIVTLAGLIGWIREGRKEAQPH